MLRRRYLSEKALELPESYGPMIKMPSLFYATQNGVGAASTELSIIVSGVNFRLIHLAS
jgi:hypothetical protein